MVNDIMDAVTRRLDGLFPGCTVYTDVVGQGLVEPCFFVSVLETSRKPMLGRRSFQEAGLCIQYIPEDVKPGKDRELNRVAEALFGGMEYITLADGGLLRGTGMRAERDMGQQVLSFLASYNMFLLEQGEGEEAMEVAKVN